MYKRQVLLREPRPIREGSTAAGAVVALDRFGNLLTNLPGEWLRFGPDALEIGGRRVPAASTYGDVPPGELVALVSSDGRVEVAVRDGSAAELLDAGVGTPVRLAILA